MNLTRFVQQDIIHNQPTHTNTNRRKNKLNLYEFCNLNTIGSSKLVKLGYKQKHHFNLYQKKINK